MAWPSLSPLKRKRIQASQKELARRKKQRSWCVDQRHPINIGELPEQLASEILSRLPARSLARCKCVCKGWLDLIQDQDFLMQRHLARATPEFITLQDKATLDTSWTEETVTTVDIFSGLLLQWLSPSRKLRIRNPLTGKILDLPDPPGYKDAAPVIIFSYHVPSREHKLFCFYQIVNERRCAILTVAKDGVWREVQLPESAKRTSEHIVRSMLIQASGAVHFVRASVASGRCFYVYSFDIGSEIFYVTEFSVLPGGTFGNLRKVRGCRWDDRPALYEVVEATVHILVLQDYKRGKWREEKVSVALTFLKEYPDWRKGLVLVDGCMREVMFRQGDHMFTYNPVLGTIKSPVERLKTEDGKYRTGVLPSLVTFDGMREATSLDVYKPFSSHDL